MYVNESQRSIVCKVYVLGAPETKPRDLLEALYSHHAAARGEHTNLEILSFEAPEALGAKRRAAVVAAAENSFGAPYDELATSGTLVWFRARIQAGGHGGRFDVFADAFAVADAEAGALHEFARRGADCVLFLANLAPDARESTQRAWQDLRADSWTGPTVVFAGSAEEEQAAEMLGHDGPIVTHPEPFAGALEAFETVASLLTRHVRSSN